MKLMQTMKIILIFEKGEPYFIKVYHKDGFKDFMLKIVNVEKNC